MSAAASARVIWRAAGRAVNGSGHDARARGDERPDVRQAGAALARPEAGPARALQELELGVALVPGGREVVDGRAHAGADDAGGRRGRERVVDGGRADRRDGLAGRHPGEDVARRATEIDDRGVAGLGRLGAVVARGHDRGHAAVGVALERTSSSLRRVTARPRSTPAATEALGGPRGHDPGEAAAGADGLDLGRAGRDDDLVGLEMEHPAGLPGDDRRTRIDPDDLDRRRSASRIVAARPARRRRRSPAPPPPTTTRSSATDGPGISAPTGTRARSRRSTVGQRRLAVGRVAVDDGPRPGRDLAGPDVGDAVDRREAVAAVAGEAERSAAARHLARPDDRDRDRVAGLESIGRPSTTIRPPAVDASVTGASGGPAGRRAARAGGGPGGAGR